ncbi:class I SAM-dependent methyltransferase [Biformimicrobium ophioploci]|uniref:Methyltransferase type 11 domain-containing protein n=1 Tax=Biformimicrobium ophioploci TaxID=3036711 RepID=A0ABQ6LYX6_9GAMM|nr:class I SAM-dependent methyltransferase [Microbulbifer sp. NKW57]GMG87271.1 hypothetical protein MNKW57_15920 [Microbulbifer sp. NKW57]
MPVLDHRTDWDHYWRGLAASGGQPPQSGVSDPALARFWAQQIAATPSTSSATPVWADICCGDDSPLLQHAAPPSLKPDLVLIDYSGFALKKLKHNQLHAHCVQASAHQLPLPENSCDLIISQFGIEYAGKDTLPLVAMALKPSGKLVALMHKADGLIYQESQQSLAAILALLQGSCLRQARKAFEYGFKSLSGGNRALVKKANKTMAPAIEELKSILAKQGPHAAGGLLQQVARDMAYMFQRIPNYDPASIFNWFDGLKLELKSFAGRNRSMMTAALDEQDLTLLDDLLPGDFSYSFEPFLFTEHNEAAAWQVEIERTTDRA